MFIVLQRYYIPPTTSGWNYGHPSTYEGVTGFEPALCLRWYIKRASLLDIPIIFGASTNLTLGFLLQDIFHHDTRFIVLCPSSELYPYVNNQTTHLVMYLL